MGNAQSAAPGGRLRNSPVTTSSIPPESARRGRSSSSIAIPEEPTWELPPTRLDHQWLQARMDEMFDADILNKNIHLRDSVLSDGRPLFFDKNELLNSNDDSEAVADTIACLVFATHEPMRNTFLSRLRKKLSQFCREEDPFTTILAQRAHFLRSMHAAMVRAFPRQNQIGDASRDEVDTQLQSKGMELENLQKHGNTEDDQEQSLPSTVEVGIELLFTLMECLFEPQQHSMDVYQSTSFVRELHSYLSELPPLTFTRFPRLREQQSPIRALTNKDTPTEEHSMILNNEMPQLGLLTKLRTFLVQMTRRATIEEYSKNNSSIDSENHKLNARTQAVEALLHFACQRGQLEDFLLCVQVILSDFSYPHNKTLKEQAKQSIDRQYQDGGQSNTTKKSSVSRKQRSGSRTSATDLPSLRHGDHSGKRRKSDPSAKHTTGKRIPSSSTDSNSESSNSKRNKLLKSSSLRSTYDKERESAAFEYSQQIQNLNVSSCLRQLTMVNHAEITVGDHSNQQEDHELWTCGQNSYGELSQGDTLTRKVPTMVATVVGKHAVQVAAGNEHTVVLLSNGTVYTAGYNDNGQCGHETVGKVGALAIVEGLRGKNIVQVHSYNGCEHTLCVTDEGDVYSFGYNYRGQLGHGNTDSQPVPTRIRSLGGLQRKVRLVSCSYYHSVVTTEQGDMFTFGRNDFGQLGVGDAIDRKEPCLVPTLSGGKHKFISISCGQYHTILSVKGCSVYSCGKNDYGQLGLESSEPVRVPTKVSPLSRLVQSNRTDDGTEEDASSQKPIEFVQVRCGYYHTLVLTNTHKVWCFGRNDFGQLGLGHNTQRVFGPQFIEALESKNVIKITAGCYHTLAVTENGMMHVFGRNNHGQLGTGDTEERHLPHLVDTYAGKQIAMVAAGFYHTVVLTGGSEDTTSGESSDEMDPNPFASSVIAAVKRPVNSLATFSPQYAIASVSKSLQKVDHGTLTSGNNFESNLDTNYLDTEITNTLDDNAEFMEQESKEGDAEGFNSMLVLSELNDTDEIPPIEPLISTATRESSRTATHTTPSSSKSTTNKACERKSGSFDLFPSSLGIEPLHVVLVILANLDRLGAGTAVAAPRYSITRKSFAASTQTQSCSVCGKSVSGLEKVREIGDKSNRLYCLEPTSKVIYILTGIIKLGAEFQTKSKEVSPKVKRDQDETTKKPSSQRSIPNTTKATRKNSTAQDSDSSSSRSRNLNEKQTVTSTEKLNPKKVPRKRSKSRVVQQVPVKQAEENTITNNSTTEEPDDFVRYAWNYIVISSLRILRWNIAHLLSSGCGPVLQHAAATGCNVAGKDVQDLVTALKKLHQFVLSLIESPPTRDTKAAAVVQQEATEVLMVGLELFYPTQEQQVQLLAYLMAQASASTTPTSPVDGIESSSPRDILDDSASLLGKPIERWTPQTPRTKTRGGNVEVEGKLAIGTAGLHKILLGPLLRRLSDDTIVSTIVPYRSMCSTSTKAAASTEVVGSKQSSEDAATALLSRLLTSLMRQISSAVSQRKSDSGHDGNAEKVEWQEDPATPSLSQSGSFNSRRSSNDNRADATPTPVAGYLTLLLTLQKHLLSWAADDEMQLVQNAGQRHPVIAACRRNHDTYLEHSLIRLTGTVPTKRSIVGTMSGEQYGDSTQAGMHRGVQCLVHYAEEVFRQCIREVNGVIEDAEKKAILAAESALAAANLVQSSQLDKDNTKHAASTCEDVRSEENSTATTVPTLNLGKGGRRDRKRRVHTSSASTQPTGSKPKLNSAALHISPSALEQLALSVVGGVLPSLVIGLSLYSYKPMLALKLLPCVAELYARLDLICSSLSSIVSADKRYKEHAGTPTSRTSSQSSKSSFSTEAKQRHKVVLPWILELEKMVSSLSGRLAAALVSGSNEAVDTEVLGAIANSTTTVTSVSHHSSQVQQDESETVGVSSQPAYEQQSQAHTQVTKDVTQVSLVLDMDPSDPDEQCIDLSATQQLSLSLLFSGGVEDHVLPQTDSLEKLVQAEIFLPLGDCNLSTTPLSPTTIGSPQRVQRARNTRTRSDPNKGVSFPTVDGTTSVSRDTIDEDESTNALVPQSLPMNRSLSEGLPQPRPLLYQAAYKSSVDDFYSCMIQNNSNAKLVVEKLRTSQAKVENSYAMALLQGRANGGIDAGALDAIERCTFGLLLKHTGFVVDAIVYGTILAREGKSGKTGTSGNTNVAPPARLVSLWSRGAKLRLQLLRYRAQSKSAPRVSRETTKPEAESKVGENNKQESSFAASCSVIQTHLCFALLFKSINPIYFPHPADPIEPLRPSSATVHRKLDVEYRKSRPLRRWTRVKAVFWIAIRMKRLAQQGAWFETQVGESAATRLGWKRSRTQTHVRSPSVPSGGEPKWKTSNSPTTGLNNTNSERSVLRRFSSHSLTNHPSTSSADPALDETVAQEVILFAQSACANAFESLNPNKETLWKSCNIGDLFQLVVHNQYRARLRVAGFNAFRRLLATSILSSPRVDVLRSLAPALRATPVPSHAVQQGSKNLSESPGGESPLSARWRNAHYAGRLGGVGCELLSQVSSAFTQLYHDLASSLAKSLTSDNRNQVDPMYSSQEQLLLLDAWTLHISKSDLHLLANTDLLSTLQLAMDPDRTRRSSMYLFEQPSTTNQSHRKFWSSVSDSIGASDSNGIVIDQANEKRTGRKKSSGDPIQQFRETQAKEFSEAAWMLFRMLLVQALHDSKLEPIVEPLVDSLYSELQLSLGELVSARIQGNQNSGSEKCLMKPLEAVFGTDDTTASCDTQTKTNIVFLSDPYHFVTTKPGMVLPWSCFAPGSCSTDALLQPSADCSISLWLHISSRARTGSQTLLLRGNKHGDHYPLVLLRDQDSRLEVELGSLQTSYEQFISKEAIPTDEWVHVVIVIEDVKVKLFVNGSISNHHCLTSQVPPLDNNEEHEIYIGKLSRQFEAYSRASLGFEGWVSMAQLHRRALSPIHVRIMCDKGLPDFNAVDDTHAFQLLALMQGLLGSDVGRQIFSRPAWIALNAKMLLHGTTRVQQAVIRSWREVLPLCHPDLVASTLLEVCSNGAAPTETTHLSDSELFVDMLLHQIGHGMWELSVDTKPGTWKDRFLFADNPSIVPGKPSKNKRGSARENSKTKNLAQCRTIDPSWETAWNKRELALELIGLVRLLQVSRNWHFIVTQRVQYHLEGMTDVVSSNTVPKEFLDLCFLQSAAAGLGTIALLGGYTDVVRVGGRVAISHADITATVVSIDRDSKTVLVVMSPKELELCANDEFQPLGDSNSKNRIKMKALRVDIEEVIAVHDVPSIFAKSHHPASKESSETTVKETNDGVFSNCHCSKHPTSNEDSIEGSNCIHQVFCKFLRKVLDGYGSIQPQEAFLDIRNKATGSESGIFMEALREQLRSRTMYIFSGALETRESSSEQQDCFMHHLFNAGGETKTNKLWAIQQTLECATYKIQSQQPLVLSVFEHQVETIRSRARLLLPVHCGVLQQPFETHRQDPTCSENGDAVIHDVEQKESNFERKVLDEGEQDNHSDVLVQKTSMLKLSTESETSIGNTTTISTTISLDTTETAIGSISKDLIKGDDLNGFGSVRDDFTLTAISPLGSHPHHSLTTMFAEDSYPGPQYENVCGVLGNRRDSGVKAAELFSASVCHSNGKNIEGVPARMTTLDSNGLQVLLVQHELALGIMYCRKAALALMQRWRQWPIDEFDSSALMPHSALPIVKLVKLLLFRGSHVSLSPILSREFYLSQSTVPVLPTLRPLLEPKHGSLAWFLERRPDAGPGLADCYPTAYPAEDSGLMTHQSVSMALTAPVSQLVRAEMLGSRKHQSFREAVGQLKLSHALLVTALRDLAGASGVVKDLKETMAVLHALDTTSQPVESFKHVTWGFRQMTNSDQHALSMPNIELSCWFLSLLIREGSELLSYKPVVSLFCNIIASSNLAIRTVAVITLAAVLRICISNQVAHIHWVLRRVPWSSLRALADQQLLTEREGKVQIGSRYLNALVELLSMHRECIKVSSKLQLNSKTPPSKLQVSNLNFKNLKNRCVEISWVWPESSISVGKVAQIKLSPQEQVSSPVRNSTKASSRAKKEMSVVYPIDKALFDSLSANTLYTCTVTILDPLILKKLSQTTKTGNEDEVEEEKEETNEFSDIGSKISNGKDESGYQVTEQDITSPTLCFLTEKAGTEFRFDKNFCGDNITITGNGSSVRYSGSEAWSMVLGSEGFVCGEHTWEVKLDVTNTAYMFIGVATHKVSLASFLGGDEHGWGYIGDRAVYHARNKLKGYGERFKQGDIIGVTLDMDRGSLSYSKNGRMMGVAVTGLTGCLYPAFAFYNKSQRITLLKTGFQSSKNSKEDGYRLLAGSPKLCTLSDLEHSADFLSSVLSRGNVDDGIIQAAFTRWNTKGLLKRYPTLLGFEADFDTSEEKCLPLGFKAGSRIQTPRGNATVIGERADRLWLHVDGDSGAWFVGSKEWHEGRSKYVAFGKQPSESSKIEVAPKLESKVANDLWDEEMKEDVTSCDNEYEGKVMCGESPLLALFKSMIRNNRWSYEADTMLIQSVSQYCNKTSTSPWNIQLDTFANEIVPTLIPALQNSKEIKCQELLHCDDTSKGEVQGLSNLAYARYTLLCVLNDHVFRLLPFVTLATSSYLAGKRECTVAIGDNLLQVEKFAQHLSLSQKLRSLIGVLLYPSKLRYAQQLLDNTGTVAKKPDDEYDYPEELATLVLNRPKANFASQSTEPETRMNNSLFGQAFDELHFLDASQLRLSYTHPMDDGQSRTFKVKFDGEGADDYGGPYREAFSQIVSELSSTVTPFLDNTSKKASESQYMFNGGKEKQSRKECILPLLHPTPNAQHGVGNHRDRLIIKPSSSLAKGSGAHLLLEMYNFMGQLIGIALRSSININLNLSTTVWKLIVGETILPADLAHYDQSTYSMVSELEELSRTVSALEESKADSSYQAALTSLEAMCEELTWTTMLSDGVKVPLVPGGENVQVTRSNVLLYTSALVERRLRESEIGAYAIRDGIISIIPEQVLVLYTAQELEWLVCGNGDVDIDLLKTCTEYDDDVSPDEPHIQYLWTALKSFNSSQRQKFLRFVWARSRLPGSASEFSQKFKIQAPVSDGARETPDQYLPKAHTCFFSLNLPRYTCVEVMREKLLYAIENCIAMDADFRVTDSEMATSWGIGSSSTEQSSTDPVASSDAFDTVPAGGIVRARRQSFEASNARTMMAQSGSTSVVHGAGLPGYPSRSDVPMGGQGAPTGFDRAGLFDMTEGMGDSSMDAWRAGGVGDSYFTSDLSSLD